MRWVCGPGHLSQLHRQLLEGKGVPDPCLYRRLPNTAPSPCSLWPPHGSYYSAAGTHRPMWPNPVGADRVLGRMTRREEA